MRHLPYEERLARLGLHSLKRRWHRADLIIAFKICTAVLDIDQNMFFLLPARHSLRVYPMEQRCNLKKRVRLDKAFRLSTRQVLRTAENPQSWHTTTSNSGPPRQPYLQPRLMVGQALETPHSALPNDCQVSRAILGETQEHGHPARWNNGVLRCNFTIHLNSEGTGGNGSTRVTESTLGRHQHWTKERTTRGCHKALHEVLLHIPGPTVRTDQGYPDGFTYLRLHCCWKWIQFFKV